MLVIRTGGRRLARSGWNLFRLNYDVRWRVRGLRAAPGEEASEQ